MTVSHVSVKLFTTVHTLRNCGLKGGIFNGDQKIFF